LFAVSRADSECERDSSQSGTEALRKKIMDFKNRVAIVTGSTMGIGRATAMAFARAGANVVVNGRRIELIRHVTEEIKKEGGKAIGVKADVTDSGQVAALVDETIAAFGRIDILVNNAGGPADAPTVEHYLDIPEEYWDKLVDLNLKGAFLCCRAVVKYLMAQRSGKIVNIASGAARRVHGGVAGHLPYTAAKTGLLGFTRALALDLGPHGINVNTLLPGSTASELFEEKWATRSEASKQAVLSQIPLRRIGKPEEIASVVLFLASEGASYITGASIDVNGGKHMS
jgi:3-oxoacyl-[acyl-carrier protein] reductase